MSSSSPSTSIYPLPPGEPPGFDTGYRYEDSTQLPPQAHEPPRPAHPPPPAPVYDEANIDPNVQSATPSKGKGSGEAKPRLRKACDSCSVRKVKCDESGPPCKSCAALEIPCTFNRPSRRRGPPNRHAEAIKRQRLEDGTYNHMAASPTRDAAYGLAALSAPAPLSVESICDISTIMILVDDYFTYIHPLIPVPHETSFRARLARREDRTDRSFLSLIAVMLEALVVSFPRRPRQLFTSEQTRAQFPHAGAFTDRCRQVFNDARGSGFYDKNPNIYDACASFCASVASGYQLDMIRMRLYVSECVMMLRILRFHRPEEEQPKGPGFPIDLATIPDYIYQQEGRRLFWLCFAGIMSLRQLGNQDTDLLMPPTTNMAALPPFPVEVDDEYITSSAIYEQPEGVVSEIAAFNLNSRIYTAFHLMSAIETAFGSDTVFDWDRQKQIIRRALASVKNLSKEVPDELQLRQVDEYGEWPPRQGHFNASQYSQLFNGIRDPTTNQLGYHPGNDPRRTMSYPKRVIQLEIQKANIHASQLATRSYLVERFWNLYEIYEKDRVAPPVLAPETTGIKSSPTMATVASGIENKFQYSKAGSAPSDSLLGTGEQTMAVEREDIIRDMAILLRSVNQVNMEPNGQSICLKIRQVASTLLSNDRSRMSAMPTLDAESVNEYLLGFCEILTKLDKLGPSKLRGAASVEGGLKTMEEIEEEELKHWAHLKDYQEKFIAQNEGYLGNL